MFKLSEVQKLNKFNLFITRASEPTRTEFTAWTSKGVGTVDLSLDTSPTLFSKVASSGATTNAIVKALADEFQLSDKLGNAAALDMRRLMTFGGSKPLTFSIDTYLLYTGEDSYKKEILEPLDKLLSLYWPKRKVNVTKEIGEIADKSAEWWETKTEEIGFNVGTDIVNMLHGITKDSLARVGDVWTLQVPEVLDTAGVGFYIGNSDKYGSRCLFKMSDVMVDGLSITLPEATMVEELNGSYAPIYDYVRIHFDFSTLRPATYGVYQVNGESRASNFNVAQMFGRG